MSSASPPMQSLRNAWRRRVRKGLKHFSKSGSHPGLERP